MARIDTYFNAKITQWLSDRKAAVEEQVLGGVPTDWSQYQYNLGFVKAIMETLAECEELRKEMMEQ